MLEWATLPENSRICVRRGQVFAAISVPSNLPVGCSGKAIQKPVASEPADTFPRYVLSGFVIQKVDAVLSEGINWSVAFCPRPPPPPKIEFVESQGRLGLHLVRIPRLEMYWLPCSTPSSRK